MSDVRDDWTLPEEAMRDVAPVDRRALNLGRAEKRYRLGRKSIHERQSHVKRAPITLPAVSIKDADA